MDLERMQALLTALQEARFAGLRSVSYDGKTVTYGSDAELAAAIRDLEGRIATASATPRRRRWGTVATKGLSPWSSTPSAHGSGPSSAGSMRRNPTGACAGSARPAPM